MSHLIDFKINWHDEPNHIVANTTVGRALIDKKRMIGYVYTIGGTREIIFDIPVTIQKIKNKILDLHTSHLKSTLEMFVKEYPREKKVKS
jgi:hypothetical protein